MIKSGLAFLCFKPVYHFGQRLFETGPVSGNTPTKPRSYQLARSLLLSLPSTSASDISRHASSPTEPKKSLPQLAAGASCNYVLSFLSVVVCFYKLNMFLQIKQLKMFFFLIWIFSIFLFFFSFY